MKKDKFIQRLAICLVVINTILCFFAYGLPRDEICEFHFIESPILDHSQTVMLKKEVDVVAVNRTTGEEFSITLQPEYEYRVSAAHSDETIDIYDFQDENMYSYTINTSDLIEEDEARFNEFIENSRIIREQGEKRYAEYKNKLNHWYITPEYMVPGLIVSVLFLLISILLYRNEKLRVVLIVLNLVVLPILVRMAYYFAFNRPTCL